jgi:hypothetical protein
MPKKPSVRTLLKRAIDAAGKLSCEDLTIRSRLIRVRDALGTETAPRLFEACFRDVSAWSPVVAEEIRQALVGLSDMPLRLPQSSQATNERCL